MYDFIVIGAIKTGTTTLHYLLSDHPDISLPDEKEAPLFLRDVTRAEVSDHVARFIPNADTALAGKVTPLYMCRPGVARRIHGAGPDTRLIAILRDPIARAVSHWRMRSVFGMDPRPFAVAAREQLDHPDRWHETEIEEDGYLAFGEYGRILCEYLEYFPPTQLLVLTTPELERDPLGTVQSVCDFLGVPPHTPSELGKSYNVSSRPNGRKKLERVLWSAVPYDWAIKVSGPRLQRRAGELLDRFGISRPAPGVSDAIDAGLEAELKQHYLADSRRLAGATDVDVWCWDQPGAVERPTG
jgi:hypothetical protein